MKTEFIHARYTGKLADIAKIHDEISSLPRNIFIGSSIQFIGFLDDVKQYLEKSGKRVSLITGRHSSVNGQILGCDIYSPEKISEDLSSDLSSGKISPDECCILIISTGEFHALSGVLAEIDRDLGKNQKKIQTYSLNPIHGSLKLLDDRFSAKGQYLKFLDSNSIGILITTKPGQHDKDYLALADDIVRRYPEKRFYRIISDSINPASLADFNFIDMFINTACPRMIDDKDEFPKAVINIKNLIHADDLAKR